MGIGCTVMSILTQFLSNRSQHVMVDGCRSKLVNVSSEGSLGNILEKFIGLPAHRATFFHTEEKTYWLCRQLHFDGSRDLLWKLSKDASQKLSYKQMSLTIN